MNDLQIFQYIFDAVESPFLSGVGTLVTALISYASAPVQTALVLYIALTGILIMRGQGGEPVSGLLGRVVKMTVVVWFATNGSVYATWVQSFFLDVLPNDIIKAVTAANGGSASSVRAASFDDVWKQAFEAGLRVWRLLDYWDVGEEIVIIVFWAAALIACVAAFAIWFLSHVILGLFIIVGPLMIGLVLFPVTRPIFERWVGSMIGCVILQVVTVILLALTLQVETSLVQKIVAYRGPNQYEQIRILLAGAMFFCFATVVLFQLPGFATALAGGLHFHTGAIMRAIGSGVRSAGAGAARDVRTIRDKTYAGASAGASAVRRRIGPQTGGSLSHGSSPPAK